MTRTVTGLLHGKHLVAGEWVGASQSFTSSPAHGAAETFAAGSVALVSQATAAASEAFPAYCALARTVRADFLDAIADEIEARGAAITEIGTSETGLPAARLEGERGRTCGQLRLFAAHIRKGDYLDRRIDEALPERKPAPRPEIRLVQRPIGPVAVFGASNFPLAFSTAGGDTASALAAGCPVVVKGHSAHPGTSEIVAQAILAAIEKTGMPKGVFSLIQGGNRQVGEALVSDPHIKAVGFTGSLAGGRALFDLCAARAEPIPFFGELGSVNPMFILPHAAARGAATIGEGWAVSLTMGAGQFCTNPGIAIIVDGPDADRFVTSAGAALETSPAQTMLTDSMAAAYRAGQERIRGIADVKARLVSNAEGRQATPALYEADAKTFLHNHALSEEVFGPLGLVVRTGDADTLKTLAGSFPGQLTVTLQMEDEDLPLAQELLPVLEQVAGRVLVNSYPTGVEVVDAMVHGGPYPASTNFGATSVGTMAIRRFLRPVCYQNFPEGLLPADARQG